MFIVLTGTPWLAHDSAGLHSNTRPIKMYPFSNTLMEDTLSHGVALRKEKVMLDVRKTLFNRINRSSVSSVGRAC